MSNQSGYYGDTVQLLDNGFTRSGYRFISWNTAKNGSGTSYGEGDNYTITSDVTLYAQWVQVYEIKFRLERTGDDYLVVTVDKGDKLTKPDDPTKEGYVFQYWYSDKTEDTVPFDFENTTITKSYILIAKWEAAHVHSYGAPSWAWAANGEGGYSATATFTCECGDEKTENAVITSQTTPATHTTAGQTVYTATVTFNGQTYTDTKTETIDVIPHTYGTPTWSWTGYESATATFTCECGDEKTENATVVAGEEQFVSGTTYKTVYTATVKFNGTDYQDTAEKTYQANTVVGTSLVLDGILGINVYVKTVPEAKTAVLTFSYTDEGQRSVTYDLSELTETGSGYRLEFVGIQSGVMDYDLILTILDENGDKMTIKNIRRGFTGKEYAYCMADWAQGMVNKTVEELAAQYDEAHGEGYGAALRELALAILNYGEKAADYFNKTFNSEDYNFVRYNMSEADRTEATADKWKSKVTAPEGYEKSYKGGTVVLEGAISLRVYFSKPVTVTDEKGNELTVSYNTLGYFVEVTNIASGDMDKFFKFNVVEEDGTSYTVEYSIMTWIRTTILNGTDAKLVELAKAMFYYWKTAHAFFYTYYWTEDENGN